MSKTVTSQNFKIAITNLEGHWILKNNWRER